MQLAYKQYLFALCSKYQLAIKLQNITLSFPCLFLLSQLMAKIHHFIFYVCRLTTHCHGHLKPKDAFPSGQKTGFEEVRTCMMYDGNSLPEVQARMLPCHINTIIYLQRLPIREQVRFKLSCQSLLFRRTKPEQLRLMQEHPTG